MATNKRRIINMSHGSEDDEDDTSQAQAPRSPSTCDSIEDGVKRSHEQAKRRRGPAADRKRKQHSDLDLTVGEGEVVGLLLKTEHGVTREYAIALNRVLSIGRSPDCDVVLAGSNISARHLRIYAVPTSTELRLAILHDTSMNGFYLNGEKCGKIEHRIGGKAVNSRSVILRDGDEIRLPGCTAAFKYTQPRQIPKHPEITHELQRLTLFRGLYTNQSILIEPWVIHNYPLGHGTWGLVNLGTHSARPSLQFAIKTVLLNRQDNATLDLLREVKVHRKIDHPNIVRLIDYIMDKGEGTANAGGGKLHLVLDLVTGGELWSYLEKYRPLREDEVRWIGWQISNGLKYLHENGIVHRDIKPENILLHTAMAYPRILIADFGNATTRSARTGSLVPVMSDIPSSYPTFSPQPSLNPDTTTSDRDDTTVGYLRIFENTGTTQYLSPEQLEWTMAIAAEKPDTVYTGSKEEVAEDWWKYQCGLDMWAMGVTLWFCASGMHPYYDLRDSQWTAYGHDAPSGRISLSLSLSPSPTPFGSSISTIRQFRSEETTIRQLQYLQIEPEVPDLDIDVEEDHEHHAERVPEQSEQVEAARQTSHRSEDGGPVDDDIEIGIEDEACRPHAWGEDVVADTARQIKLFWVSVLPLQQHLPRPGGETGSDQNAMGADMLVNVSGQTMDSSEWFPVTVWSQWSGEGIAFLRAAMAYDPDQRLKASDAHEAAWFQRNLDEIEVLRQKVMVRGEVIRHLSR
ncbi:hypothetical protein IAU59_005471 [Kwoniella sp. CBS 9459]